MFDCDPIRFSTTLARRVAPWCALLTATALAACSDDGGGTDTGADTGQDVGADVDPGDTGGEIVEGGGPSIIDLDFVPQTTRVTVSWSTDVPSTAVVSFGLTDQYELGAETGNGLNNVHNVVIDGLEPNTEHYFRVVVTGTDGESTVSGPHRVSTLDPADADPSFVSDDFSGNNLDTGLWSFTDPPDGARVAITGPGTEDAMLELHVPGGVDHDVWTVDDGVSVMQPAADTDLEIEVKFESVPVEDIQVQGVLVKDDADTWLRFDFHRNGGALYVFASRTLNGRPQQLEIVEIGDGGPLYMRINRLGDTWTQFVSRDGEEWDLYAQFVQPFTVNEVGIFGANLRGSGTEAPAFTVQADYFFDNFARIDDEDGGGASGDEIAPLMHNFAYGMSERTLHVELATDEATTATLEYGLTDSYELGSVAVDDPAYLHGISVDGVDGTTPHHFRVTTEDAAGNTSQSEDLELDWNTAEIPVIEVFYGPHQTFGALGEPQEWVNITGNAYSPAGYPTMTYQLDGGAIKPLGLGPDNARLHAVGDFNVEVAYDDLEAGEHEVVLTVTDPDGRSSSRTVTFDVEKGNTWPESYDIDWSEAANIHEVAQPVDGLWELDAGGVRPVRLGYDRTIAIGDTSWTDYEVTFSIEVFDRIDNTEQLIGVGLRWPGHSGAPRNDRPRVAYWPSGAFAWYRWTGATEQFQFVGNNDDPVSAVDRSLSYDTRYNIRARVETLEGGGSVYNARLWEDGTEEPEAWDVTVEGGVSDPRQGAILLVVHYTDAVFGDLSVRPLD